MKIQKNLGIRTLPLIFMSFIAGSAFADTSTSLTLGNVASEIIDSFDSLTKLIMAAAYIAGVGFMIGAIFKFKQHRDTPQQITVGQPIALLLIGASLLFLPTILGVAGATMFGSAGGETAGPTGTIFTSGG